MSNTMIVTDTSEIIFQETIWQESKITNESFK